MLHSRGAGPSLLSVAAGARQGQRKLPFDLRANFPTSLRCWWLGGGESISPPWSFNIFTSYSFQLSWISMIPQDNFHSWHTLCLSFENDWNKYVVLVCWVQSLYHLIYIFAFLIWCLLSWPVNFRENTLNTASSFADLPFYTYFSQLQSIYLEPLTHNLIFFCYSESLEKRNCLSL